MTKQSFKSLWLMFVMLCISMTTGVYDFNGDCQELKMLSSPQSLWSFRNGLSECVSVNAIIYDIMGQQVDNEVKGIIV